jgi:hypothetical protein
METKIRTRLVQVYADPAHAWAKVRLKDLFILGIAEKITRFSYERGDYVYLEEIQDLLVYREAIEATGVKLKFKENWTNRRSKIRSYSCYSPR